jgi:molybdopterin-guanine dinucleotide biosynthesis protein A
MIDDCTALILAGGHSRRMGCDKTALRFNGQSLLQRMIGLMQTIFPAVLVSVGQFRADNDVPQVCDEIPDAGPLAGLCAGLQRASSSWVFAVAADMPALRGVLVEQLAAYRENHQAVVPVVAGFLQPLAAFYAAGALPVLKTALARGERSVRASLTGLDVCRVDAQADGFIDLDTPEDVAAWKRNEGIQADL